MKNVINEPKVSDKQEIMEMVKKIIVNILIFSTFSSNWIYLDHANAIKYTMNIREIRLWRWHIEMLKNIFFNSFVLKWRNLDDLASIIPKSIFLFHMSYILYLNNKWTIPISCVQPKWLMRLDVILTRCAHEMSE